MFPSSCAVASAFADVAVTCFGAIASSAALGGFVDTAMAAPRLLEADLGLLVALAVASAMGFAVLHGGWRRKPVLPAILDDPARASTPQGMAAEAVVLEHDDPNVRLKVRLDSWDEDVQAAVRDDAGRGGLDSAVIARIAAAWPAEVAGPMLGAALTGAPAGPRHRAALAALVALPPEVATRELLAVLARPNAHKYPVAAALHELGAEAAALGILLPQLEGPGPMASGDYAIVGELGGADALPCLLDELSRRDPDARPDSVVFALGGLADPRCEGALLARLPTDGDALDITLVAAIESCAGVDALPRLVALEDSVTSHFVRIRLHEALYELRQRTGVVEGALAIASARPGSGALGLAGGPGDVALLRSEPLPSPSPAEEDAPEPSVVLAADRGKGGHRPPRFLLPPLLGLSPQDIDALLPCPWIWLWAEHSVSQGAAGRYGTLRLVVALPEAHPHDTRAIQAEVVAHHAVGAGADAIQGARLTVHVLRRVPRPPPDLTVLDRAAVFERARGRTEVVSLRREFPVSAKLQGMLEALLDPETRPPDPGAGQG